MKVSMYILLLFASLVQYIYVHDNLEKLGNIITEAKDNIKFYVNSLLVLQNFTIARKSGNIL